MSAWSIIKDLDLTFNDLSDANLKKIVDTLDTQDIDDVISDLNAAKEQAVAHKQAMDIAIAIVTQVLKAAL